MAILPVLFCIWIAGTCLPAVYPMTVANQNEKGPVKDDIPGPGVKLHRPDGTIVYINAKAVAFVRAPLSTEVGKATIVFTGGATQSVQEPVEDVIKLIAAELEEY